MYGKATETAVAAVGRLAEVYDGGSTLLSAAAIAETRGLQAPFLSKILTVLATAGIVRGSRGPGGGFTLARPPAEITLYDVFALFERVGNTDACPFGGGICGVGDPCPLHDKFLVVKDAMGKVLHETTFAAFQKAT